MSQALGLPKCFALRAKHTGNYLRSMHGKSDDGDAGMLGELISGPAKGPVGMLGEHVNGLDVGDGKLGELGGLDGAAALNLKLGEIGHLGDGAVFTSPHARFFIEPSKEHDGLVHVRCGYNNKYWVPQEHVSGWTIGTAHEPERDLSKPSCTLFKPICSTDKDNNLSVRFLHAQLGKHVCMLSRSGMSKQAPKAYLHIGEHEEADEENSLSVFTVLDLSEHITLPTFIVIKGDNGKYLSTKYTDSGPYQQFSSDDIGDPTVIYAPNMYTPLGAYTIRPYASRDFWCRFDTNWIQHRYCLDINFLFKFMKVGRYIAIKNCGNQKFCKRLTTGLMTDCLSACADGITTYARLQVEEPVLSREIYDVVFHLSEARIYYQNAPTTDEVCCVNTTSLDDKAILNFTYTKTESSTWNASVSLMIGVETSVSAGIPFVAKGEVKVKAEVTGSYSWGKTYTTSTEQSASYEVGVRKGTKVTVTGVTLQGCCDVPFSYKQKDILTNGEEVNYDMDDGMYYGVNHMSVRYDNKEEKI